jgi:hypothetical protein
MSASTSPIDSALHLVTVHIVARSRHQATGRFSLRVTPGGWGTPEFGPDQRRVRISGTSLIVESDASGSASASGHPIIGATLRELAEIASVDLRLDLDVGHDTPPMGDPDAPLLIDDDEAASLVRTYAIAACALDATITALHLRGMASTVARLWPEHFDVAIEADAAPGRRVNLGVSPGDGFHAGPYAYVGPWTADRPGDGAFWNAPFGAFMPIADGNAQDAASAVEAFLLDGVERLR